MPARFRHFIETLTPGRRSSAVLEILVYAFGLGILFYVIDVLLVRWQGLALH